MNFSISIVLFGYIVLVCEHRRKNNDQSWYLFTVHLLVTKLFPIRFKNGP